MNMVIASIGAGRGELLTSNAQRVAGVKVNEEQAYMAPLAMMLPARRHTRN